MFENLKQQIKEKKIDRILQTVLGEGGFEQTDLKAAFADKREMKEILSEIYSLYDGEGDIYDYCSDFSTYIDLRCYGYSKQFALWQITSGTAVENELDRLVDEKHKSLELADLIKISRYYQDYKDTECAIQDVKMYIKKRCRWLSNATFSNACSSEMLAFCKKYKGNDRKFLGKESLLDKYHKLELVYSSPLPTQKELDNLSDRMKRMDDDDMREGQEQYYPKVWKYFSHIVARKIGMNIPEEYKDVIALTVIMGLADDKLNDLGNAVKYVDKTLSYLDVNLAIQDVENLCEIASEQCKKEIEINQDFQSDKMWAIEQLARLVAVYETAE